MSDSRDAKVAWVERVLGIRLPTRGRITGGDAATPDGGSQALEAGLAHASPAARAEEVVLAPGRGVAYRKLLLRWREAQTTLNTNLSTLGKTLLARPDIQADPRLDIIKEAVAALTTLVPQFGGKLEDVLDAGLNASDPDELAHLATNGIAAIDQYRAQLATDATLLELEEFVAKDLGSSLPLHAALDQTLLEIRQQLTA